jgi:hypothetical protein
MGAAGSSKTLVHIYHSIWHYILKTVIFIVHNTRTSNLTRTSEFRMILRIGNYNLQDSRESKRPCYTQWKQVLHELLIELKSAIKINNSLKDETECGGNQISECKKCNILSFQLQETLTELKLTQFIIKILQDELFKSGVPCDQVGSG